MAYVANVVDNTISVINTATNTVTTTIHLATSPSGIVASPDGSRLYVGDSSAAGAAAGNIYVVDTSSNAVIRTILLPTGAFADFLAITPDGKTLLVTYTDSKVLKISTVGSPNHNCGEGQTSRRSPGPLENRLNRFGFGPALHEQRPVFVKFVRTFKIDVLSPVHL